jgi:geranylgeranyl diphosphate synthase type II
LFSEKTKNKIIEFDEFSKGAIDSLYPNKIENKKLIESIQYSFLGGGKRFRPALTFVVADLLKVETKQILPWCLSLEMIHTYSLIHDDLPCMDDDDFRRGKATNHKLYGESIALLAGDALLTEAFGILAQFYANESGNLGKLINELAFISGIRGMIGGQFLDMELEAATIDKIKLMHQMKTGALISGCFSGPGIIKGLAPDKINKLKFLGQEVGFLFQVKDDILDYQDKNQDIKNIVPFLGGIEKSRIFIESETDKLLQEVSHLLDTLGTELTPTNELSFLLKWNQNRNL